MSSTGYSENYLPNGVYINPRILMYERASTYQIYKHYVVLPAHTHFLLSLYGIADHAEFQENEYLGPIFGLDHYIVNIIWEVQNVHKARLDRQVSASLAKQQATLQARSARVYFGLIGASLLFSLGCYIMHLLR